MGCFHTKDVKCSNCAGLDWNVPRVMFPVYDQPENNPGTTWLEILELQNEVAELKRRLAILERKAK